MPLNGAYYKKRTEKDLSFHRRPAEASELRINLIPTNDTSLIQNNIYANGAVVNNNLKNIFDIYKTLSFNQQKLLHEAFNFEQQAQRWMIEEQKPRNYIEQIRYYLETDAGRKALNRNFDGTNKWYSRQSEPYFINSMVQNHDK